jgi:hypothetical protein
MNPESIPASDARPDHPAVAVDFRVRRATVDDLPALSALWHSMSLSGQGLESRLTEFQVAVNSAGAIAGAIGFQIVGKQALVHSECFIDFSLADTLRPLLWERLKMLAANHGTIRVWSKESTRFWAREALDQPDPASLEKLPADWKGLPGKWYCAKLREDVDEVLSLDKEFALFAEAERERSRTALSQARLLKTIATVLAIILALAVLGASVFLVLQRGPVAGP